MTDKLSRQAVNALRQQTEVKQRVIETRQAIRIQIRASFDKDKGRFRYVVEENGVMIEKSRFYESDFLKRSGIDKNTLKRDYHSASRNMVSRLVIWVNAKIAKAKPIGASSLKLVFEPGTPTRYHAAIAAERDAIAERYAILEIELSDALRGKRVAEQRMNEALADLRATRDSVASLTDLLLKIGGSHESNVVPITGRNRPDGT